MPCERLPFEDKKTNRYGTFIKALRAVMARDVRLYKFVVERLSPLYNGSYDDAAKLRHIRQQVNERVPYNL